MRIFILRARKAYAHPRFSLTHLDAAGRIDTVCRCVLNALAIPHSLRRDTMIHCVFEGPGNSPLVLTFEGKTLRGVGLTEYALGSVIRRGLSKAEKLSLGEKIHVQPGFTIVKQSFELLVKHYITEKYPVYYLHPEGDAIANVSFSSDVVFLFGDYIGLPQKTEKLL